MHRRVLRPMAAALLMLVSAQVPLTAQSDTVKFQWPNPPFNSSHNINGTFCEYRNTLSANHFHSGVDIGEPDDSAIYPCINGTVYSFSTTSGDNNFVRVRTNVGGQWKHISYVHIQPNPGLSNGDSVFAGQTVLGTVLTGMGHVHLTERELASTGYEGSAVEINAIRAGGGLTPYDDPYSPVISPSTLQFRQQETGALFPGTTLSGKVDISVRVNERNGPGGIGLTQTNNGTFAIGYRIRSADTNTVVYAPPDSGMRYRFDRKPYDSDVDIAFVAQYSTTSSHYYYVTNGTGASAVSSGRSVADNFFDTMLIPEGEYLLEVFTEDTRGNTDSDLFPITITRDDLVPPSAPILDAVIVPPDGSIRVEWTSAGEPDLDGFRLYYQPYPRQTDAWYVAASESLLADSVQSFEWSSPSEFEDPSAVSGIMSFRLTAVDTASPPNESSHGDIYSGGSSLWASPAAARNKQSDARSSEDRILVVDGFDRFGGSGSWGSPTHAFVQLVCESMPEGLTISSWSNDYLIQNAIDLPNYHSIVWVLGDESTADNTFTSVEQQFVKAYLEGGGRLFVSGSEIGWDLGRNPPLSQASDTSFYHNYLKAGFEYDGNTSMYTAAGVPGTILEGYLFTFGQTYPEDYPDDINPINGSAELLRYNATRQNGAPRIAGITYEGTFGGSSIPGKLVYLAFPFESISVPIQRLTLLTEVLQFFDLISNVPNEPLTTAPTEWRLSANYPNPFNPQTAMLVDVPASARVTVRIYDMLGRLVETLLDDQMGAGTYTVTWNAGGYASGVYYARLETGGFVQTQKLMLVR